MRLIDADELTEHMYREAVDTRTKIAKLIKSAPTVDAIPADWLEAEIKSLKAENSYTSYHLSECYKALLLKWKRVKDHEPNKP